jgi:hypothetical protein
LEAISDVDDDVPPIPPSPAPAVVRWSKEEELELEEGVRQWGAGRWADILENSTLMRANGKTNVKLKIKWRNMEQREFRAMTPKQESSMQSAGCCGGC